MNKQDQPDDTKNLGRAGYLLSGFGIFLGLSTMHTIHTYGLLGYFIAHLYVVFLWWTDVYFSNATAQNFRSLEKNGYSLKSQIYPIMILNFLSGYALTGNLVLHYSDQIVYRFDVSLVLIVGLCLALTDVAFWTAHRALHQHFPHLHKLHHCCRRSSFTTNLLFHPLDFALEFTGPAIVVVLVTLGIFNDPFAMLVTFSIITTWYAADHDEYIQLPHWNHHKYINSNYWIYHSSKEFDPHDKVRTMIL